MNCDNFLAALETGGLYTKLRARGHAARCPRCAALHARFAAVKMELAVPEPLSPRARQLWTQAAHGPAGRVWPLSNWVAIAGTLAAAACIGVLFLKLAGHKPAGMTTTPQVVRHDPPADPTPTVTVPTVTVVDPSPELAQLSAAVDQLDADLKEFRLNAERIDARRQVAMTLRRFDRW